VATTATAAAGRPWYKNPVVLGAVAAAVVVIVLVIALPVSLVKKGHSNSNSGSGTGDMAPHSSPLNGLISQACGTHRATGFSNDFTNQSLVSGDYTRNYSINVPASYNDNNTRPWPVIIDYHGNSRNGTDQYNNSMFYAYPAGQEYIAVYPEGVNNSWQGPSYAIAGVDDLQFTTDLLAHLNTTYCIDHTRIYASGKSNGAGFVDTLACSDNGDAFAAFAMASAALYTDTSRDSCNKSRAVLESHGKADTTIPYDPTKPGKGGELPPIRSWVKWWSERNGCASSDVAAEMQKDGYDVFDYDCRGANSTVHYAVEDLGHCWPSGNGENFDARTTAEGKCEDRSLDFTPVVLEFFERWHLGNAPRN